MDDVFTVLMRGMTDYLDELTKYLDGGKVYMTIGETEAQRCERYRSEALETRARLQTMVDMSRIRIAGLKAGITDVWKHVENTVDLEVELNSCCDALKLALKEIPDNAWSRFILETALKNAKAELEKRGFNDSSSSVSISANLEPKNVNAGSQST